MKIKVSETTNPQLNFMVAKATGMSVTNHDGSVFWGNFATVTPATNWNQGGPLIEREEITLMPPYKHHPKGLVGWHALTLFTPELATGMGPAKGHGPTPLIAAMRAFVISRLGDEVEVPDELST